MQKLADYFDSAAEGLDCLYDGRGLFHRSVDRVARAALFEYPELVFAACGPLAGRTVLDVGCGPGFYLEACAARGASATGVDLSPTMLSLAHRRLRRCGATPQLIQGDIANLDVGSHDVVLAIGLFDYSEAPAMLMGRLAAATKNRLIASFPVRSPCWSRLRSWRYRRRGIGLRFYSRGEVAALAAEAGLEVRGIAPVRRSGGGLLLVADAPKNFVEEVQCDSV